MAKENLSWENRATVGEIEALRNDPKCPFWLDLKTVAWIRGTSYKRTREAAKAGQIPGARLECKRWKVNSTIFFRWLDGEMEVA